MILLLRVVRRILGWWPIRSLFASTNAPKAARDADAMVALQTSGNGMRWSDIVADIEAGGMRRPWPARRAGRDGAMR